MRRRVEQTEDDEEEEDSRGSSSGNNSPQYDFPTVDRDPVNEGNDDDDDDNDDMEDDEDEDATGNDQYDKEDTRDMYDVHTSLSVYPDLRERFGLAIQVIEKWRFQKDNIDEQAPTPYIGEDLPPPPPTTKKAPIVDPTEGFRHIMSSAELLDEDGTVIIHDNQQQRTNTFLGQIAQDELCLTTFQKAWRENPDAWRNPKLHWAHRVVDNQFKQMTQLFYYLRFFAHSLTETLCSTVQHGKFPYTSTALEETKHYQDVFNFFPVGSIAAPTDKMKLLQYALQEFALRRFKKKEHSDFIYTEVVHNFPGTTKVVHTCCYHSTESIEKTLYKIVNISSRADLVQAMLSRSLVEDVLSFLIKGTFEEFPFLEVRNRLFSFTDGIWDADTDTFVDYDHIHDKFPDLLTGSVTYKFFDLQFGPVYWESVQPTTSISSKRTAGDDDDDFSSGSKRTRGDVGFTSPHHNYPTMGTFTSPQPSPPHMIRQKREWRHINNPLFEKIFVDQGWSQESIHLKYATLGRTLWPAGEKDSCQYIPVDIGESATGKSTAQNVWQSVFHFTDIMVFGANQEKGFSRDKIVESRIFLAPDMRGDSFGISPEFFLVLAASDPCVFPRKHKDPIYVDRIRTPGMLATNELPPGFRNDVRGSIFRRLLPFGYTKEISPRDPGLKDRIIKTELAGVLRKAVLAYQDDAVHPRDKDIMTDYEFPPEIQEERNKLERSSNSLVDFLLSPAEVRKDEHGKTPYHQFVEAYGRFCKNNRQQKPCSFSVEFYTRPLKSIGAQVIVDDDGEAVVKGCTLVYHRDEETSE
jgi:hypothetical protein